MFPIEEETLQTVDAPAVVQTISIQSPASVAVKLPPTPTVVVELPKPIDWLAFCATTHIPDLPTIFIVSPRDAVAGYVNVTPAPLLTIYPVCALIV